MILLSRWSWSISHYIMSLLGVIYKALWLTCALVMLATVSDIHDCVVVSSLFCIGKDNVLTCTDLRAEGRACARRLVVLIQYPLDNVFSLSWLQMMQDQSPWSPTVQGANRVTHHTDQIVSGGSGCIVVFFTPSWPSSLRLQGSCWKGQGDCYHGN